MNYKTYIILPTVLILLCTGYILYITTTAGLNLDIDLKGGNQISIESSVNVNDVEMENALSEYDAHVRVARGITGYSVIIEFDSNISPDSVIKTLEESGYTFEDYSVQTIGPALSTSFFEQAQYALIMAFVLMAIVVFILFRKPMPSFYVVLCAAADIIETLAISQILGIKLSLATFAALLLLLGYSVDTDILLTTRVLKMKEGSVKDKVKGAMKTGLTMISTTTVAAFALFIISASSVIIQIASVLLIGLLIDVFNTWVLNANLLRWYVERKGE